MKITLIVTFWKELYERKIKNWAEKEKKDMTVREKIEELKEAGIEEIKLYADATNEELPLTDGNLDAELGDCIIADNTADLYI